jgi:hypothetical protein
MNSLRSFLSVCCDGPCPWQWAVIFQECTASISRYHVFLAGFWKKASCADDIGQLPDTENRCADELEPRASRGKRTSVLNSISVSRGRGENESDEQI